MNLSRKISLSFLLMTISVPVIFCFYFSVKQQIIRQDMLDALEQLELQTLVISPDEVEWIEKGKEMLINGELFDVREYHIEDGKMIAKGLYDQKETELKASLERSMKEDADEENASKIISKLITNTFHDRNHLLVDAPMVIDYTSSKYSNRNYNLFNADISLPYPPPKA